MASIFKRGGVLRRFGKDRSGNFSVVMGATISMLAITVGYGVNVAQIYNVRSNLIASLDSALTSTGRDISTGAIKESEAADAIKSYLAANGDPAVTNGGNQLTLVEPLTIDRAAKTITATAYVDVDAFLPLFGQANRTRVSTTAGTLYTDVKVEVGLMLDVTGSMGDPGSRLNGKAQTKLQNLQVSAKDAVEKILSRNQPGREPRVRVAIIPYSQGVNAGVLADGSYVEYKAEKTGLLSGLLGGLANLLGLLGLGEIQAVTSGFGLTEPGEAERPIGLAALENPPAKLTVEQKNRIKLFGQALDTARSIEKDGCTTERKIKLPGQTAAIFDPSEDSPDEAMINRDQRLGTGCPSTPVTPLTTDVDKLTKAIAGLKAGGGTAGQIGIQWTQYLLSPRWGDFLSERVTGSRPAPYSGSIRKVAILMTDGEFNAAYAGVPAGSSTSGGQATRSGGYAKTLCDQMKRNNIEVFTIGFMLKSGKDVLQDCATPDTGSLKHFYDASNAAELDAAFEAITQNFEVLRLTH